MRKGDDALLGRLAAVLRVVEQLERARDQTVEHTEVAVADGTIELRLVAAADVTVSRWAAQPQAELFCDVFGRELAIA